MYPLSTLSWHLLGFQQTNETSPPFGGITRGASKTAHFFSHVPAYRHCCCWDNMHERYGKWLIKQLESIPLSLRMNAQTAQLWQRETPLLSNIRGPPVVSQLWAWAFLSLSFPNAKGTQLRIHCGIKAQREPICHHSSSNDLPLPSANIKQFTDIWKSCSRSKKTKTGNNSLESVSIGLGRSASWIQSYQTWVEAQLPWHSWDLKVVKRMYCITICLLNSRRAAILQVGPGVLQGLQLISRDQLA